MALAKLAPARVCGGTIWDIGAGIGTVAIEAAILNPQANVLAVERSAEQRGWIERNRERFATYNVRILPAEAPAGLLSESAAPHSIFVGGSGGQLAAVLDLCRGRLEPGGRLVANFVTLENLAACLSAVAEWDWRSEVVELSIARSERLGTLTGLRPGRSVWIVCATKPA